ncbi:MAG TPA: hypothetical protein VLD35_11435 [Caldimonas sp.]|nr:hypothetical protein [Caldimonas sp.]
MKVVGTSISIGVRTVIFSVAEVAVDFDPEALVAADLMVSADGLLLSWARAGVARAAAATAATVAEANLECWKCMALLLLNGSLSDEAARARAAA